MDHLLMRTLQYHTFVPATDGGGGDHDHDLALLFISLQSDASPAPIRIERRRIINHTRIKQ